jgi:hypothetical protein
MLANDAKYFKMRKNISLVRNIVVHVNGLGFTLCVSAKLFKFILCHVKQCKCKCEKIYIYMILHNCVKQIHLYCFMCKLM